MQCKIWRVEAATFIWRVKSEALEKWPSGKSVVKSCVYAFCIAEGFIIPIDIDDTEVLKNEPKCEWSQPLCSLSVVMLAICKQLFLYWK